MKDVQCIKCSHHGSRGYGWCSKKNKSIIPRMLRSCDKYVKTRDQRVYSEADEPTFRNVKVHLTDLGD